MMGKGFHGVIANMSGTPSLSNYVGVDVLPVKGDELIKNIVPSIFIEMISKVEVNSCRESLLEE